MRGGGGGEAIKCNWPDSRYTILREALDMAVKALEDVTDKNVGKMTNADRIRAMTDEELVNVIPCPLGFSIFRCPIERQCGPCKREWLKQPVEEETL